LLKINSKEINKGDKSHKINALCSLETLVPTLKPVQEKILKVLFDFDVLTKPQILLTDEGYIFVFELRSKEEVLAAHGQKIFNFLISAKIFSDPKESELQSLYGTQKKRPRTWRSMDRMIRWFSERGLMPTAVLLQITTPVSLQRSKPKPRRSS
jgi:hypothetical protein